LPLPPCPCFGEREGRAATTPAASGRLLELLPGRWAHGAHHGPRPAPRSISCCDGGGWRGSCLSFAGRALARLAAREHRQPGEAVLGEILGWVGRRWGGHCQEQTRGVRLQGSLRGDWEQAGSSLGARGDVFSSLKFDFRDLLLLLAAAPPVPLPALGQVVLSLLRS